MEFGYTIPLQRHLKVKLPPPCENTLQARKPKGVLLNELPVLMRIRETSNFLS